MKTEQPTVRIALQRKQKKGSMKPSLRKEKEKQEPNPREKAGTQTRAAGYAGKNRA